MGSPILIEAFLSNNDISPLSCVNFFAADVFFAACQRFEFFIGLFDAVAAHHGLDGYVVDCHICIE